MGGGEDIVKKPGFSLESGPRAYGGANGVHVRKLIWTGVCRGRGLYYIFENSGVCLKSENFYSTFFPSFFNHNQVFY